jgi:hypothetical protein
MALPKIQNEKESIRMEIKKELKLIRMNEVEATEVTGCDIRISLTEKSRSFKVTPATEKHRRYWR